MESWVRRPAAIRAVGAVATPGLDWGGGCQWVWLGGWKGGINGVAGQGGTYLAARETDGDDTEFVAFGEKLGLDC